jgi:hypothetical protein
MKKIYSSILTFAFCVMAFLPVASSAATYECVCNFAAPKGASCSDASSVGALPTGVTVDSPALPNLADTDPNFIACKKKCPDLRGAEFCSLSWSAKGGDAGAVAAPVASNCPPGTPPGATCLTNPLNVTSVPALLGNIMSTAIGIIGALALLIFIYGGMIWLTSGGVPAKISAGKDAMKWAAIGLVIVFTSYALVSFVFKALTG